MSEHLFWREQGATVVGRVVVEGGQMRIERKNPIDGSFVCIGYYEDLRAPKELNRKVQEIDSVFDDWARAAETLGNPNSIKANWHHGQETPREHRRANSDLSGVLVVNYKGGEIAHIYKTTENAGRWISSPAT